MIEQRFETMQSIAHGIAQQWFGIFLSPYKWYVTNNSITVIIILNNV